MRSIPYPKSYFSFGHMGQKPMSTSLQPSASFLWAPPIRPPGHSPHPGAHGAARARRTPGNPRARPGRTPPEIPEKRGGVAGPHGTAQGWARSHHARDRGRLGPFRSRTRAVWQSLSAEPGRRAGPSNGPVEWAASRAGAGGRPGGGSCLRRRAYGKSYPSRPPAAGGAAGAPSCPRPNNYFKIRA